ncbi:MAG: tetratricopeptide repeat protein [Bacteroidales bacterium]
MKPMLVLLAVAVIVSLGCGGLKHQGSNKEKGQGEQDVVTSAMMEISAKYIEASREKIIGNLTTAERLLQECLKADPKHHPSMYQLADISHMRGNYADALYWIGEAEKLDNSNVWYKVLHGDLLLKSGQYREAVAIYREINTLKPGKRIWFEACAYAQKMAGDQKGAAATYQEILDHFGYDESIFMKMIGVLEESGNQKRVEESLQWLVHKFPYDTRYLGYLASHYYGRNLPAKALPLWEEILRLEPANGEVRFELANYYRDRGEDDRAFQELFQAFSTPNLSIDAKIVVLMSYYELTEKDNPVMLGEAYKLLEVMVERHPENPKGWSMYGDYLYRDQRFEASLNMMKRVVELDSSRYLVWEQLLDCAMIINDFTTLTHYGERALRYFPEQARLYLWHGEGLFHMERYAEALEVFRKGYFFTGFSDSLSCALLHAMARSNQQLGDMAKAGEHYQRALEKGFITPALLADYAAFVAVEKQNGKISLLKEALAKKNGEHPLEKLAAFWIQRMENEHAEISGDLSGMMEAYSASYPFLLRAGFLWQELGNKSAARDAWEKALRLSNGDQYLETLIIKAKQ